MYLYNLTLQRASAITIAVQGNFSGSKLQELLVSRGRILELIRQDPNTGKVLTLLTTDVFGIIRDLKAFRLTGGSKDYIVVSSDSGRIVILEYNAQKNAFEKVHQETFGKSGCRRIVPGQYLAIDPKGRSLMLAAVEKQKLVYILNRDSQARLTISSPLEAHKNTTVVYHCVGVDVGFENPLFACLEMDYENDLDDPERGMIFVCSATHKTKVLFFFLAQTEQGDIFKITLETDEDLVTEIKLKYFDTVPVASSMCVLKTGFLFVGSEFGNHFFYQIANLGDDDDEPEFSSAMPLEEGDTFFFAPRGLRNLLLVDEMDSLSPIMNCQIADLANEDTPQLYVACGRGPRSSLRVLRHGLEVTELAVSELPGNPNAVWTVKRHADEPYDAYIIVSFVNATLVLSIGETVEEVTDSGFIGTTPTLACAQLGDNALVQIYPEGIRHIRADKRVNEWRSPGKKNIVRCAVNHRQVVIALTGGELVYFEMDAAGQLNEYTERKELNANVLCMGLGTVPAGEQRSRFLAVGLDDNTVRIISLDPNDCLTPLAMQALPAPAESLCIVETGSGEDSSGSPTSETPAASAGKRGILHLNIGLTNGVLLRTILDQVTGDLSDTRTRYLGSRPVKLFMVRMQGSEAVLAMSSRSWLSYSFQSRFHLTPLSYEPLEYASGFSSEQCAEGIVAISTNTLRILTLEKLGAVFNQAGQLNEYTERKELNANVLCMGLGTVPAGEQRSRFLAVGLDDNTVRIISLDPNDCLTPLAMQALPAPAESLCIVETGSGEESSGSPTSETPAASAGKRGILHLNIGLTNGVLLRTILDQVTGDLSDTRTRYLGSRPVKLFMVRMQGSEAVLAMSSRSWLSYSFQSRFHLTPLSYEPLEYASGFSSEQCAEGIVAISTNTLRILTLEKLGAVFNQVSHALEYTPRRFAIHQETGNIIVIETDHNAYTEDTKLQRKFQMAEEMKEAAGEEEQALANEMAEAFLSEQLPESVFGAPKAGPGMWASLIRVLDPVEGKSHKIIRLDQNEAAMSVALVKFSNQPAADSFLIVGVANEYQLNPRQVNGGFLYAFKVTNKGTDLVLLHKTPVEEVPGAMAPLQGKVLVSVGRLLRVYEMGKKKMLRKCESKSIPNYITSIQTMGSRVFATDIQESTFFFKFRPLQNQLVLFADDTIPRWVTCSTLLDFDTVALADKFGNVAVIRLPTGTNDDTEEDPTGNKALWDRGYLNGASQKAEQVFCFHVGETVLSLQKATLIPGGNESLVYTTLSGTIGVFVVESSDVVLEVLDARDPLGCRSKELEEAVLETKGQKRLVLVLNKADLVPRANLKAWLEYLRKEFPTVAFKAATAQNQVYRSRKQVMKASLGLLNSTQCLGADMVMSLLGNYCRNKGIRTSITVGVVGFPNVGKSSLINSLKRNKSCNVGAVPGVTRTTQLVQLDKHIRLLDSPGMVLAASSSNLSAAALALRNAVRVEAIEDPITPVEAILERATKQQLMIHYKLPAFNTVDEFLGLLARRSGYLRKGGIADPERAARSVLLHWNSGKIKYFTEPPSKPLVHVEASLVSEMAKEFDLEAVDAMSTEMLEKKLPRVLPSETLKVDAQTVVTKLDGGGEEAEMQGEDQPMEDEEDNDGSFSTARTKSIHGL
ncbi:unnamed protein product, partial [Cyprideis torosa]